VSCDGRLSDTSGVFVLDAESGTVERSADVFFDFERQLDDEEEGIETTASSLLEKVPLEPWMGARARPLSKELSA